VSRNLARPLATGAAFMLVSACAPTSPLLRDASVTGAWGGEHVRLQLTPAGGAIDYDCAHGSLAGPLRTDGEARFVTTGFHVREHGGPIREGEPVDSVPATYLGSVVGPDDAPCGRGDRRARPFRAPAGRHTAALQVSLSAGRPSVAGTTPSAPPAHRGPASLGIRSGL